MDDAVRVVVAEATIAKLSLSPGDKLLLICKDEELNIEIYKSMRRHIKDIFPNNEVLLIVGDVDIKIVSENDYGCNGETSTENV